MNISNSNYTIANHVGFIKLFLLRKGKQPMSQTEIEFNNIVTWWYDIDQESHNLFQWIDVTNYTCPLLVCSRCLNIIYTQDAGRLLQGCSKCKGAWHRYTITEYEINFLQSLMRINKDFVEYLICLTVAELACYNPNYKEQLAYV